MNKKMLTLVALFPMLICCGSNDGPSGGDEPAPGGDDDTPSVVPHEDEKITYVPVEIEKWCNKPTKESE